MRGKKTLAVATLSAAIIFGGQALNTEASPIQANYKAKAADYTVKLDALKDLQQYLNLSCDTGNSADAGSKFDKGQQDQNQEEAKKDEQATPQKPANNQNTQKQEAPKQDNANKQENGLSEYEQKVVELTNAERAKQGLKPLEVDAELSKVAREKSRDMQANNYFDHNSPTYGSPFDMMKKFGITYNAAGENIAQGQQTPEEVVKAWMNSEGHRENIMNADFTHIGVGYVEQGNYWTQQFIGK